MGDDVAVGGANYKPNELFVLFLQLVKNSIDLRVGLRLLDLQLAFNLGSALAFAQTLPAGVYVAMNGRCFPAQLVEKNSATGLFDVRR